MPEVLFACARPGDIGSGEWDDIASWLDESEKSRALRFRHTEDERSYVLSHALMRAVVAAVTGRPPASLHIDANSQGQPFVAEERRLRLSNSRSRTAVACAASFDVPLGVDVESIGSCDEDLLDRFVAGPRAREPREFFARWTALEAFWKSFGTGLADENPCIAITPTVSGQFVIHLDSIQDEDAAPAASGWSVDAFDDCAVALVIRGATHEQISMRQTRCSSASDIKQLSRAFFTPQKRSASIMSAYPCSVG